MQLHLKLNKIKFLENCRIPLRKLDKYSQMDFITILRIMISPYLTDTIKFSKQIKILEITTINFYGTSTLQTWILSRVPFKRLISESIVLKSFKDILNNTQVFFHQAGNSDS